MIALLKRAGTILALSFFLVSCGHEERENKCLSKQYMTLKCQADELSGLHFPSQWQIDQALKQCERLYPINKCY